MASFKVEVKRNDIMKAGEIIMSAVASGVYQCGEEVMRQSQRLVPVLNGILKSSGMVTPPNVSANGVVVDVGYGGAAGKYAVRQHEDLTFRHTVGQAKFLEIPALQMVPKMGSKIAAVVRQRLKP